MILPDGVIHQQNNKDKANKSLALLENVTKAISCFLGLVVSKGLNHSWLYVRLHEIFIKQFNNPSYAPVCNCYEYNVQRSKFLLLINNIFVQRINISVNYFSVLNLLLIIIYSKKSTFVMM